MTAVAWDEGGSPDVKASTGTNWDGNVAPDTGDAVTINTGSASINWDIAKTMLSLTVGASFSGSVTVSVGATFTTLTLATSTTATMTHSASFTIGTLTMQAGTLTGDGTNWIIFTTAIVQTGGTVTGTLGASVLLMKTTATISTWSWSQNAYLKGLWVSSGTLTYSGTGGQNFIGASASASLRVDTNCTLSINGSASRYLWFYPALNTLTLNGTITGAGYLAMSVSSASTNVTYASLSSVTFTIATIQFSQDNTTTGGTTTLSSSITTTGNIQIVGGGTSGTRTLDLSSSNFALTCANITVSTRGSINMRASIITTSGTLDSTGTSATITEGTSTIIFTGTSKSIKLGSSDSLYCVHITGTISLTANFRFKGCFRMYGSGTFTRGAYTATTNGTATQLISGWVTGTAIVMGGTNLVEFINSTVVPGDITVGSGAFMIYHRSAGGMGQSGGNFSVTQMSMKFKGNNHEVVSGTLTIGDLAIFGMLQIDAGATVDKTSGIKMVVLRRLANAGTLTLNSDAKNFLRSTDADNSTIRPHENNPINQVVIVGSES